MSFDSVRISQVIFYSKMTQRLTASKELVEVQDQKLPNV